MVKEDSVSETSRVKKANDIIIITGEIYDDHPFCPTAMIKRVLEAKGFSVGLIEKPITKEDFTQLGEPRLCFAVTSGAIDSMVHNYTPLKKKRIDDEHSNATYMPDRAVTLYCNKLREYFKGCTMVIGGIEASLRRFAHYDYWDNSVRKSILLDSRANILVYGNGEKQIIEIAERLNEGKDLLGVQGTCILSKNLPDDFVKLPSFAEVSSSMEEFCKSHVAFTNLLNLAQEYDNNYVLQYKSPKYTPDDLDFVYSLPFTRKLRSDSELKFSKFSIQTHRGCFGSCNFCSIALHQGEEIISRSEKSILDEIRRLVKHPDFRGYIDDLGGPSANMYGMDCDSACGLSCIDCKNTNHDRLIKLMKQARAIPGVKKVFVRSGIRYDLAMKDKDYIKELSDNHISGCLKIAPEHVSSSVLKNMNKDSKRFSEFVSYFNHLNKVKKQELRYYFMICYPGEDKNTLRELIDTVKELKNVEQFQMYTPTPMSISSCMYWTSMDPFTMKKIEVVHDYYTKKVMKREFLDAIGKL